jgi:uncharacterized protein (TIGR03382 family)
LTRRAIRSKNPPVRSLALVLIFSSTAFAGAPIIEGTADSGDPAVVQIYAYPPTKDTLYTCTGIVIAPKEILTAGHCLDHDAGYIYGVFFGADANAYMGQIALVEPYLKFAASVHVHPQYQTQSPFLADIGVLNLVDATDVTPLAINRTMPTDALVNAPVQIIGYGETTVGTIQNAKFAADTIVVGLDNGADTILVGDAHRNCVGDSGGPVLQNNIVLGVDSYSTAGCGDPAHFRRTDYYADFIDSYSGGGAGSGSGSGSGSDMGSGGGVPIGTDDKGGGCSTTGQGSGLVAGLFVAALLVRRRRYV